MKKKIILLVVCLFVFAVVSNCAELKWFKGDLNKALEAAKKENKVVMIDFFTDWCTPCKILEKMVWQDEEAVKDISKLNIIPMKLDAEKEGKEAANKYSIKAYPTIIFINKDGEELARKVGFGSKEDVIAAIKKNCKESISIKELKDIYEKDPDNFEAGFNLAKKISETQIDEAISIYKNIYENDKENLKGYKVKARVEGLLLEMVKLSQEIDKITRLRWIFLDKPKQIDLIWGEKAMTFDDTKKSIDFLYKGIMANKSKEIVAVFKKLSNELKNYDLNIKDYQFNLDQFDTLYNSFFDENWNDVQDAIIDTMILFDKNLSANNLNTIAWHNYQSQRNLEEALTISQRSCEISNDDFMCLDTQAHILMSLGQKEKAIEIEKKAIEKAKSKNISQFFEQFETELSLFEKNQLGQLKPNVAPANPQLTRAEDDQ